MLGHLELLPDAAAADADSMFSHFPRLGSETPTSAGTDISERMYSILSFFPRHAQWVGTFGSRVRFLHVIFHSSDCHMFVGGSELVQSSARIRGSHF